MAYMAYVIWCQSVSKVPGCHPSWQFTPRALGKKNTESHGKKKHLHHGKFRPWKEQFDSKKKWWGQGRCFAWNPSFDRNPRLASSTPSKENILDPKQLLDWFIGSLSTMNIYTPENKLLGTWRWWFPKAEACLLVPIFRGLLLFVLGSVVTIIYIYKSHGLFWQKRIQRS